MTHDPRPLDAPAQAPGWPEVAQLLPPTLTIEVSSGWTLVALIALWIWLDRMATVRAVAVASRFHRWCVWYSYGVREWKALNRLGPIVFIFIDETGGFIRSSARRRSISCVGALVVPETHISRMYREFGRLRKNWPLVDGESKGRVLNEQQIRATIAFLQRFDVIFTTVVVDINLHTDEQITAHRMIQAEKITEHVTAEFLPEAAQSASEMRARLEKMPNQLYVQSVAMTELMNHVIQKNTLYYSQRKPRELANFHWALDAKDNSGITDFEDWWSLAVMPMLQSMSMKKGLITLKEGDYRWFDRSFGKDDLPAYLHGIMPESKHGYLDITGIVRKSFCYKSSHEDLGLQLADILVSTTRRALVGNLQRSGWEHIGRLMLRLGPQVVDMISLGAVQDSNDHDLFPVFKTIKEEARPILRTPKGLRW